MYAQSAIKVDGKFIEEGSKVTKKDVGVHYDALVEAGALSEFPRGHDAQAAVIQRLEAELAEVKARLAEATGEEPDEDEAPEPEAPEA